MRALVTGISGFVGGHLTEHLVAEGDIVVGLSTSGRWPTELAHLAREARIERFDLVQQSEADLADLVRRKQPEVIYHLAAQSNPQASLSDSRATWTLNFWGSFNLLEAVKASGQTPRVVLVSSGVCYGNPPPELIPVKEDCPLRPTTPYAASKAAVDLLGIQHYLTHGTARRDRSSVQSRRAAAVTHGTCWLPWLLRWPMSKQADWTVSKSATST